MYGHFGGEELEEIEEEEEEEEDLEAANRLDRALAADPSERTPLIRSSSKGRPGMMKRKSSIRKAGEKGNATVTQAVLMVRQVSRLQ